MRSLIFILYIIAAWPYSFAKSDVSTKTFKSKKYGFEFTYPINWKIDYGYGGLEPDEEEPLDEFPSLIVIDQERYLNRKCDANCKVYIGSTMPNPTDKEYKQSLDFIEKFERHPKDPSNIKPTIFVDSLNGNKVEYLITYIKNDGIKVLAYLYCEDTRQLINFTNRMNRDVTSSQTIENNTPMNLETLFYPEQIPIIKSIKCPPKDFVYKKSEKIKSKKK